jgi:hypothetical protein
MRLTLIKQFVRQRGATGMSLFILTLIQMYSRSFPTLAELLKRILRMPISWRKRVISCCQVMMVSYKIMVSYVGEKLNRHQVQPNDFEPNFDVPGRMIWVSVLKDIPERFQFFYRPEVLDDVDMYVLASEI